MNTKLFFSVAVLTSAFIRADDVDKCGRIIPEQVPFFVDSDAPVTPTRAQLEDVLRLQVCRIQQVYDAYLKGVNNVADVAHAADAIHKTAEDLGAPKKQQDRPWASYVLVLAAGIALGHFYI